MNTEKKKKFIKFSLSIKFNETCIITQFDSKPNIGRLIGIESTWRLTVLQSKLVPALLSIILSVQTRDPSLDYTLNIFFVSTNHDLLIKSTECYNIHFNWSFLKKC